jgi:mannitol-1-phosphate/altronate dehydrogenase
MIEVPFDPEEAINDAAESLAELGVEKLPASLRAAHRQVADRASETCTTLAAFMVDGVMHTAVASADWHYAFDEAIDETLETARAEAEAYGRADAKTACAEITAKAAILAAHPSFNFSRVSFEKRLTLAKALFADSGDLGLREVTRVAENLFWLEQSGFKPPPQGNIVG